MDRLLVVVAWAALISIVLGAYLIHPGLGIMVLGLITAVLVWAWGET